MNKYLEQVELFMTLAGQDIPSEISIENKQVNNLRSSLLFEELEELTDALVTKDSLETLDALCDLQYVLSGAILALGFKDVFDKAFEEVQRSNMSKFPKDYTETAQSAHLLEEDCEVVKVLDRYVIKRKSDGKVLKPSTYFKPNLKQFINGE